MKIGVPLAGAVALAGVFAVPSGSRAAVLTVDLNDYASAVLSPNGTTLGAMTVTDLLGGGVSVVFALQSPATYFASTGGAHITTAFNLDTAITAADITNTTPSPPNFNIVIGTGNVPGGGAGHFGTFTAGLDGKWSGTSNHFAGPITFDIADISTSDFVANADGYFAVADLLARGTGDVGGKTATIVGTPEPATWAMLLLGFAGLAFAGYRKAKGGRIAPSTA